MRLVLVGVVPFVAARVAWNFPARAGRAAAKQQSLARAAVTRRLLGTDGKPMPAATIALMETGGTVSKAKARGQ
ncbi:MAG: hypothetical protein ACKV19_01215 [Verrucomicrobiales bacterium]